MKSYIIGICLLFSVHAFSRTFDINIDVNNISAVTHKAVQMILETIPDEVAMEELAIEECQEYGFSCDLKDIKAKFHFHDEANEYLSEFSTEGLLYKIDLPRAQVSTHAFLKGKIGWIKYDAQFDVEIEGVTTVPRGDDTLPGFDGAGAIEVLSERGSVKLAHKRSPFLQVGEVKIEPRDTVGWVVYRFLSTFMNIEQKVKDEINSVIAEKISSEDVVAGLNVILANVMSSMEDVILPIADVGLLFKSKNHSLNTADYGARFRSSLSVEPIEEAHECAQGLKELLEVDFGKDEELLAGVGISVPYAFIGEVIFLMMKHAAKEGEKPILCQGGVEKVKLGPLRVPVAWEVKPTGTLKYEIDQAARTYTFELDVLAKGKNVKGYPKLSFYRKYRDENGNKVRDDFALATVRISFYLDTEDEESIKLKLQEFELLKIEGKAMVGLIGPKIGFAVKLEKLKEELKEAIYEELLEDIQEVELAKREIILMEKFNLRIEDVLFNENALGLDFEIK